MLFALYGVKNVLNNLLLFGCWLTNNWWNLLLESGWSHVNAFCLVSINEVSRDDLYCCFWMLLCFYIHLSWFNLNLLHNLCIILLYKFWFYFYLLLNFWSGIQLFSLSFGCLLSDKSLKLRCRHLGFLWFSDCCLSGWFNLLLDINTIITNKFLEHLWSGGRSLNFKGDRLIFCLLIRFFWP